LSQLFDANDVAIDLQRVSSRTYDLLANTAPDSIVFVGILTNGLFFAKRIQALLKKHSFVIESPVMGLDISLYRDDVGKKETNYMSVSTQNTPIALDAKHVVLFDDVLCTARTARAALNAIFDYGRPEKVSFVTLYDRGHRQVPIEPTIIGKKITTPMNLRVNVGFLEVTGSDHVNTGPFE
jgi:pyrimidine operon attenuation protein/uracil phosphoribosyltransferase